MNLRRPRPAAPLAALLALLALASCARKPAGAPIRLGIMPDADSLPFMVAADEGFFTREGIQVELVSFANAQERDAAIQAGRLDGAISDLLAAAFAVAGGFDMAVTSVTDGRYGIAAAPGSKIEKASALKGASIGMSTNTIIQYAVDSLLAASGVPSGAYTVTAIPKMPVRMEMLLAGKVDAAGLPEPFLSVAAARGARIVATTDAAGIDAAVVLFFRAFLDTRLADVKKLYHAYDDARQSINADPDKYRDFLIEKASFPEEARYAYKFVAYRKPSLPSESQVEAVLAWLGERKLLSRELKAREILDGRAVAGW